MTKEEAEAAVRGAALRVNPDCFGSPGRIGNLGIRLEQRGERFDITINSAGPLFDEYDVAFRDALRGRAGIVTDNMTGRYTTSARTSEQSAPRPNQTFINYGPIGAQQIGDRNTASVVQTANTDQRVIHETVQLVRDHLEAFPSADRDEVAHHLETIEDELERPEPRAGRMKTAFGAIRRFLSSAGEAIGKVALEAGLDAVIKQLAS